MKRCIMVMFDSLNRHMLPTYNANSWIKAPNFERLAQKSATFDTSYVCSMPCMPARRDFHTGRPNFLHCDWGPLEPFDDSVPQMLQQSGVYTHLITDHYHYFEDGGATYHNRYNSWEAIRGQEGDSYIGMVAEPPVPKNINGKGRRSDWVNRTQLHKDSDYPQSKTFQAGLEFIERNHSEDNWFVQIECFDPHEPFTSDPRWQNLYPSPDLDGALFDWPSYDEVKETPEQVQAAKNNYAALVTKCDDSLGKILDAMDTHNMWQDTMLVVWTDHGFLFGEHGKWAKNWPLLWEEVAHTPFFIWDPQSPNCAGQRRKALVQPAIDLGPTLLTYFGNEPTANMTGKDLAPVLAEDTSVRDSAIYGYHGERVNVTDGHYVYFSNFKAETELNAYTLMPTRMRGFKPMDKEIVLADPFSFTKGLKPLKLSLYPKNVREEFGTRSYLYDCKSDPGQLNTIDDPQIELRMQDLLAKNMRECDAPPEVFTRVGL